MSRRRRRCAWTSRTAALATSAALGLAAPVAGALVEFTFEGTVVLRLGENPDHPWGDVQVGDPMSFSYVIDVSQPDQAPMSSRTGIYDVASAALTFDGISLIPETIGPMVVRLDGSNGADEIEIDMEPFGERPGDSAFFKLFGGVNTLPDDGIPIDFDLNDFFIRQVTYGGGEGPLLRGQFDSYTYQIIPAPGAFVILGASLFRTGRRRRSPCH